MKNEHRHERIGKRGAAPYFGCPRLNRPLPTLFLLSQDLWLEKWRDQSSWGFEGCEPIEIMIINIMPLLEILGASGTDLLAYVNISFSLEESTYSWKSHMYPSVLLISFSPLPHSQYIHLN